MAMPMGTPTRQLPREERRQTILQGAAKVFSEGGFAATSMEAIAGAAGITKLILYRHFDSKEELYRSVIEDVETLLAEEFAGSLARGERDGMTARAFLNVARENPDGFRLLWRHSAREPQFSASVERFRRLATEAAKSLLAPRLPDASLHVWGAETLIAFLVEGVLNWLDDGTPARDDEFVALTTASLQAMVDAWVRVTAGYPRYEIRDDPGSGLDAADDPSHP